MSSNLALMAAGSLTVNEATHHVCNQTTGREMVIKESVQQTIPSQIEEFIWSPKSVRFRGDNIRDADVVINA